MSQINHGGAQLAEAVKRAYELGQDDYHLEPMVLTENGVPVGRIQDNDAVIFCCRRGEREIELTEMFTDKDFSAVDIHKLNNLDFSILTFNTIIELPRAKIKNKAEYLHTVCK